MPGDEIPLASRIVFCADAFHAIRSDRPYRAGRSARAAIEEVKLHAGTQFDPRVTKALVKSAAQMHTRVRRGAGRLRATLRSRRLVALLLTLAIGGSALAAGGAQLLRDDGSTGSGRPASASPSGAPGGGDPAGSTAGHQRAGGGAGQREQPPRGSAARPSQRGETDGPDAGRSPREALAGGRKPGEARGATADPNRPSSDTGRSDEAPRRPLVPGKP